MEETALSVYVATMRRLALFLSFSLFSAPIASALAPIFSTSGVLLVPICGSDQFLRLDVRKDGPKEQRRAPHAKACHAVCCSDDEIILEDEDA